MGGIFSAIVDPIAKWVEFLTKAEEHAEILSYKMDQLKTLKYDVMAAVDAATARRLKPTDKVQGWLKKVEEVEYEASSIHDDFLDRQRCFLCTNGPLSHYRFSKRVSRLTMEITDLMHGRDFNKSAVTEQLIPAPPSLPPLPTSSTVGMDRLEVRVLEGLYSEQVGIIGIYGMGGVGKTQLMKRIHNRIHQSGAFDLVIWLTAGVNLELASIRKELCFTMGLSFPEDLREDALAGQICKALGKRRFLLLLDDMWEHLDFEAVGIPHPDRENMCKIIFTTRSMEVCRMLEADMTVRVEVLHDEEAWELFRMKVGEETLNSDPEITKLAHIVAEECRGLPLALITVGRAMRGKHLVPLWRDAVRTLTRREAGISGMSEHIFSVLKFSYDRLEDDTLKSCFLYCSILPEDHPIVIEKLIDYWLAEGFMGEFLNVDEAHDKGRVIVQSLLDASLLQEGPSEKVVQMHDILRDFAIHVASWSGRNHFLVKAGLKLVDALVDKWEGAERISLMENEIRALTTIPMCPNLLTLMLQGNRCLKKLSGDIFIRMPVLRVLDLSDTAIESLPSAIGALRMLRYLSLSHTSITTLPYELGDLVNLEHLNLSYTLHLRTIPKGVISRLSSLGVLNLYFSRFVDWGSQENGVNIEELECLQKLAILGITLNNVLAIKRFASSPFLRRCTGDILITKCNKLAFIKLPSTFGIMKGIRVLNISSCGEMEALIIGSDVEEDDRSLSMLEELTLNNLPVRDIIWKGVASHGLLLSLRRIDILNCPMLKHITWVQELKNLEQIYVGRCKEMEAMVSHGIEGGEVELVPFARLKSFMIFSLPKLRSICSHELSFPSLEEFEVFGCPNLKQLPRGMLLARNTLREIRGEKQWWDGLQEDDEVKSTFLRYFKELQIFEEPSK